jgi:hypothetical protein
MSEHDTGLSSNLRLIAALREQKDELEARLKAVKTELTQAENSAVELLAASGMEKVTTAGRTWWQTDVLHVSIPKHLKSEVLDAAQEEGVLDETVSPSTSFVKAWLSERAKENGVPLDRAAEGTAFEGLIRPYVSTRLSSVKSVRS